MLLPRIWDEDLFENMDNWMSWPDESEFFGKKNPLYGKHAKNLMKTDVRETEDAYEVDIDLPGFKKDEVTITVENGYLNISAVKGLDKNGKWTYYKTKLAADHAVMNEFVVNPDIRNNVKCWHLGGDKLDNYYKHLYPLNQAQYRVINAHFTETGEDSEDFILKVMNDVLFKQDDWGKCYYELRICGVGYVGSAVADTHSVAYQRWKDMLYRCYSGSKVFRIGTVCLQACL